MYYICVQCVLQAVARCSIPCSHLRQKNIVQVVGLLFRGSLLKGIVMEMMGKVGPLGPAVGEYKCSTLCCMPVQTACRHDLV